MTDADFDRIRPLRWEAGALYLLDQRVLPQCVSELRIEDAGAAVRAIRDMVVRGAPAIGLTGAYGLVLAAQTLARGRPTAAQWRDGLAAAAAQLAEARPTAVHLRWALRQMQAVASAPGEVAPLLAAAQAMQAADVAANRQMAARARAVIEQQAAAAGQGDRLLQVLTHCNTGSLATAGYGTALGAIRSLQTAARLAGVFATETRPWLQGARLTAWELAQDGIPVTLVTEGGAAALLARGDIDWLIVGADRIAANGDTVNKIGTYGLMLAARANGVHTMVVAPLATVDLALQTGRQIPIEQREAAELLPAGADPRIGAYNPAFDVTPAALIDWWVTEHGALATASAEAFLALAP